MDSENLEKNEIVSSEDTNVNIDGSSSVIDETATSVEANNVEESYDDGLISIESEPSEDIFVEPKKSKKKLIITISTVAVAIVAILLGVIVWFYSTHKADKFIDNVVKTANDSIINLIDSFDTIKFDLNEDDVDISGNLKLNTNDKELSVINNYSFDFDFAGSLKNKYMEVGLGIKEGSNKLISGSIFYDNGKAYLESKDLYNYPLNVPLDDSEIKISEDDKKTVNDVLKLADVNNAKKLITTLINAYGEALKSSNLTTKISGSSVRYTYEVNNENLDKVNNRFEEIIAKDSEVKELYETVKKYFNEDSNNENMIKNEQTILQLANKNKDELEKNNNLFNPMVITVEVNLFSNEIKHFEIYYIEENERLVGEMVDKKTYRVGNEKEYTIIKYNNDFLSLVDYVEKEKISEVTIEKEKDMLTIKGNDNDISLEIKSSKETGSISFSSKEEGIVISSDFKQKDKEMTGTMEATVTENGIKVNITLDYNFKFDKNLVSKKDFSNAKDINSLTEEDMKTIYDNLMNKFGDLEGVL